LQLKISPNQGWPAHLRVVLVFKNPVIASLRVGTNLKNNAATGLQARRNPEKNGRCQASAKAWYDTFFDDDFK